jgi:hypothetical protein
MAHLAINALGVYAVAVVASCFVAYHLRKKKWAWTLPVIGIVGPPVLLYMWIDATSHTNASRETGPPPDPPTASADALAARPKPCEVGRLNVTVGERVPAIDDRILVEDFTARRMPASPAFATSALYPGSPFRNALVLPRNPTECPTEACIHEWQRRDDFIVETQPKVEPFPGYRLRAVDEDGRVALRLSFGEHELARASVDVYTSEFDGRLSCPDFRAVVRAMVGQTIAP